MSREQLTDQQTGHDTGTPATEAQDQTYGLRPDLYDQIMQMSPADADQLAAMLGNYPQFIGRILPVAAQHMGNAAVQRAIALTKKSKEVSATGGSQSQDEIHDALRDPIDSRPVKSNELASILEDKSDKQAPEEQAEQPKQAPAAEPAWVAGARRYNEAHSELVNDFNDLTDFKCQDDDTGMLDPEAVASWQRAHGLDPDGKVGQHTVAAARAAKAKLTAQAAHTDERPPV